MGNGTFRDTLVHTKTVFLSCTSLSYERRFYDSRFWFIVLKHICGAQTPFFENVPFTFGVTYFCSELECDLVFAFFLIMRRSLDNDQYSLVVSHGWNVDI